MWSGNLESIEWGGKGVADDIAESLVALARADPVALAQVLDADGGVSHG